MTKVIDKIIGELTSLATELYEFLLHTESHVEREDWRNQLHRYVETALHIRALAMQNNHDGVHSAARVQQEYLNALIARVTAPTTQEWDALERWPLLLLSCMATPVVPDAIEELVAYCKARAPHAKFNDNDAQFLRAQFQIGDHGVALVKNNIVALPLGKSRTTQSTSINAPTKIADGASVRYLLQHELLDTITEFISDNEFARTSDDYARALRLCADRMQLLGISAAGADLIGFMDCCLLCHDALYRRLETQGRLTDAEAEQFKIWGSLAARYLDNPNDVNVVDAFMAFYRRGEFIAMLVERDYESLREFLLLDVTTSDHDDHDDAPTVPTSAKIIALQFTKTVQATAESHDPVPAAEQGTASTSRTISTATDETSALTSNTETSADVSAAAQDTIKAAEKELFSDQARELLQLVRSEIEHSLNALNEAIDTLTGSTTPPDARVDAAMRYGDAIERFVFAAQSVGLVGLTTVLAHIRENLAALDVRERIVDAATGELLRRGPSAIVAYLAAPGSMQSCAELVALCGASAWLMGMPTERLAALELSLLNPVVTLVDDDVPQRATRAQPDDVSLRIPTDVNPKLLDSLLYELPQHVAEFSACIQRIAGGAGSATDVANAQRNAHTLKGAANTVGVVGVATLTHHVEDILLAYSKHDAVPNGSVAHALVDAADTLEAMAESLSDAGEAPGNAVAVLQQILDLANRIDAQGLPDASDEASIAQHAIPPESIPDTPAVVSEQATVMLRVPATVIDNLLRLVGESIIMNGQLQERLRQALRQAKTTIDHNLLLQQLTYELEQLVDVRGVSSNAAVKTRRDEFDALELDQYNELDTVTRRLVEAATDAREMAQGLDDHLGVFGELLAAQSRTHKETQEAVMSTRMVPAGSIAARLQRGVRQTCRLTSKHVELVLYGVNTLVDSDILDDLVDPLMHVLRNAIDHGIEPVAQRKDRHKPETGRIELTFAREGDHFTVLCRDDGAGLDYARIRQEAINKGFIDATTRIREDELTRMILLPGFTTRTESTQTSGRGIGLDAVYARILKMKGSMQITSEPNQGCIVELRVPITLISMHALLVRSRNNVLAISSRGVEQILYPGSGTIEFADDTLHYRVGEDVYDAYELEALLQLPIDRDWIERADRAALLVRDATSRMIVVFVEHVMASQDLVVKQLGAFLPKILGIEGATILGNGSVAPVVDLPGLLQTTRLDDVRPIVDAPDAEGAPSLPVALVVDDSLSARRSLAEFVKDLGFEVHTACDGLDALETITTIKPDLILVDMEMPRMNGLELTEHLRVASVTKELPIIMITSRATQKHREQARTAGVTVYLTKPFSEEELEKHIRVLLESTGQGVRHSIKEEA